MNPDILIYTSETCIWCDRAKTRLKELGLPFSEINITKAFTQRTMLLERGCKTVPQIVIDDKWIGGFTELNELYPIDTEQAPS